MLISRSQCSLYWRIKNKMRDPEILSDYKYKVLQNGNTFFLTKKRYGVRTIIMGFYGFRFKSIREAKQYINNWYGRNYRDSQY